MSSATFEKPDDGTFAGRIPACQGVVALGDTLMACQRLLQSTLEDWLLLDLRIGACHAGARRADPRRRAGE